MSVDFQWFIFDSIFAQFQEHGVDYMAALLAGDKDRRPGFTLPTGSYYNRVFPGARDRDGATANHVKLADTTAARTVEQYSKDVSAFLMWAAEPHMVARKRIGFQVMSFLLVFAGLLYMTKKKSGRASRITDRLLF